MYCIQLQASLLLWCMLSFFMMHTALQFLLTFSITFNSIQRARPVSIESSPWLAFPTLMQETHWIRMQISTQPMKVVPTKTMLVPPVVHWGYVSSKNQQRWWQRTQLVDPHSLLELHPFRYLCCVVTASPPLKIPKYRKTSQKKSTPSIIQNPNWEKWQIMKNQPWNHETQNLESWNHAHSSSGMFTSSSNESGDLCDGVRRCVLCFPDVFAFLYLFFFF